MHGERFWVSVYLESRCTGAAQRKGVFPLLFCEPAEVWRDSLPKWTDNLQHTLVRGASTLCSTCVLWRPRSSQTCVRSACVFIVFVSDELLAATRLQWGNWYTNDIWQGYTELTQTQTFSPFSLFFTSFSLSVSELSWQQLCGRKTLRCCFSMSLWSTVIHPQPLLPIVISRDSFNMLLVIAGILHITPAMWF